MLPEVAALRLAQRQDLAAATAQHIALLTAAAASATAHPTRPVLVRVPAALLAREAVLAAVRSPLWVGVDTVAALPPSVAAAVRRRGARLGVVDGPPAVQPLLDFVLLPHAAGGIDTQLLAAQRWHEAQPRVAAVAVGLPHLDDVERLLRAGFTFAGGQLGRSAGALPARPLGAAAHRICELMNHLALDRDTVVVADAVRADVALSYRMMRYANSPAIGLARGVESVEQAVQVLGRAELRRWLSVMLLSAAESRTASKALQEAALARGRLLEVVGPAVGLPDAGAWFALGLLSLIEPLLQVPMATALAPLRLGADTLSALVARQGPLAWSLELLEALDAGDASRVDVLWAAQGAPGPLAMWQEDAWAWAAAMSAG